MKTRQSNNYGWEKPELMHQNLIMWHSRLNFVIKELDFLNSLLNEHVFPIVESNLAGEAENLKEKLNHLKTEVSNLLMQVNKQKNELQILFKDAGQGDSEWDCKHHRRKIMIKVHEFDSNYHAIKKNIFSVVKKSIRHKKQKKIAIE